KIGEGSDGAIEKFKHRRIKGKFIVVKMPVEGKDSYRKAIQDEIRVMKNLQHPNIVHLLGYDEHWIPYGPALFYEFCQYGDIFTYHTRLVETYGSVPEETLWKFFADVSKALNYLHNELNIALIHGDMKPENVLIVKSSDCFEVLPRTPLFKIADLARAVPYSPEYRQWTKFNGTPEYAPPPAERRLGVTPAFDTWGLGATLQQLALGVMPILRWETFVKHCPELQRMEPAKLAEQDPQQQHWRDIIPCVYRPLNVTTEQLKQNWDWSPRRKATQYSNALNRWYSMCMEADPDQRITAAELVKRLVPVAERQISVLVAKRKRE
ncbi:kinase-like protein, partial [Lophiostoma macrostomum CBS 122681]